MKKKKKQLVVSWLSEINLAYKFVGSYNCLLQYTYIACLLVTVSNSEVKPAVDGQTVVQFIQTSGG